MTTATATPFRLALLAAMNAAKRRAKADGCVRMSLENWRQVTRPPPPSFDGAPRGTNARYMYARMFEELAAGDPFLMA